MVPSSPFLPCKTGNIQSIGTPKGFLSPGIICIRCECAREKKSSAVLKKTQDPLCSIFATDTAYLFLSNRSITFLADNNEISCSVDCPPQRTRIDNSLLM